MARMVGDVAYRDVSQFPAELLRRFHMDVYVPDDSITPPAAGFPALVWLHGGAVMFGDKRADNNLKVGPKLADHGFVVAMINYRFANQVAFPGYALDALTAVKWMRDQARAELGLSIDSKRIFLGGHSAGGYVAGIAGFNEALHREAGLQPGQPAGLVLMSGQMFTHFTLRQQRGVPDAEIRPVIDDAAPAYLVHRNVPPTLLMVASDDMQLREQENIYTAELLRVHNCRHVEYHRIADRDHGSVYSRMCEPADEAFERVLRFLKRF